MGTPATMACGGQGAKVVVVELVDWDDPKNNKWWSLWMNIRHGQWTIQGWIQGWPVNSVKSCENHWQSSRPAMFFLHRKGICGIQPLDQAGDLSPMWSGRKSGVARSPLRCALALQGVLGCWDSPIGSQSPDVQADVFSCGCVLFELLSWSLSFNARTDIRYPAHYSLTVFGCGLVHSQHETPLEAFTCPGTLSIVCLWAGQVRLVRCALFWLTA